MFVNELFIFVAIVDSTLVIFCFFVVVFVCCVHSFSVQVLFQLPYCLLGLFIWSNEIKLFLIINKSIVFKGTHASDHLYIW